MEKLTKAREFLGESRQELKKVVWPTREQATATTRVVIVFVFVIAIFLGFVDFVLGKLVHYILG